MSPISPPCPAMRSAFLNPHRRNWNLFAAHAPIWEIDVASDADQPGTPYWRADSVPTVIFANR